MKTFNQLINEARHLIPEIFPWDLQEKIFNNETLLLIDVRESDEFSAMHIENSLNIPRGILETACEFGFAETVPTLAGNKVQNIIVICRSGNRSLLAAKTLFEMGFCNVSSLKTGLRGWNDFELPLFDSFDNDVDMDFADNFFSPAIKPEQLLK